MDNKLNLFKEVAKLSAYTFVTVALVKIVLVSASSTKVALDAAFKK